MITVLVIVSGLSGSGKSTLAEKLAKHFRLKCVHASDIHRQLMEKGRADLSKTRKGEGWWESEEAEKYFEKRVADESLDRAVDERLLELISTEDNLVVDSWTMPWLSRKGFKIWVDASQMIRAERVAARDKMPIKEVLEKIKNKDENTGRIYKKIYGFNLGKDMTPFNLLIDSSKLDAKEVFEKAVSEIEKPRN